MKLLLSTIIFLICSINSGWAFDYSPFAASGPTLSAQLNFYMWRSPKKYENWRGDPKKIESMFINSWGLATQSSPVDNRAYLFSLAVDLYNSLGPETNECPPDAYQDEEDNPEEGCGKYYIWGEYNFGYNYNPERMNVYKRQGGLGYIDYYLIVHSALGGPESAATIAPAQLDLTNPTLYRPMQKWLAQTATAMAQGVPPWQAEEWTAEHRQEWGEAVTSTVAHRQEWGEAMTSTVAPTTQAVTKETTSTHPAPQSSAVGKKPAPGSSLPLHEDGEGDVLTGRSAAKPGETEGGAVWWVLGGVVLLLVGGLGVFFVRRRG